MIFVDIIMILLWYYIDIIDIIHIIMKLLWYYMCIINKFLT